MNKYTKIDLFSLELGKALCQQVLLDDILKSISEIRKEIYEQYGLVIPNIRVKDNKSLKPFEYVIKVSGIEISRYELKRNCLLILDTGSVTQELKGRKNIEPAFGFPALWISSARKELARERGYLIVSNQKIIKIHLIEIIKANLTSVITTQYVSDLFDEIMVDNKALCTQIASKYEYEAYGIVKEILKTLIKDNICIRNIIEILEVIANEEKIYKKNIFALYEKVRLAISPDIVAPYIKKNTLKVLRLSRSFSEYLFDNWKDIDSYICEKTTIKVFSRELSGESISLETDPVIICVSPILYIARKFINEICNLKNVNIISDLEMHSALELSSNIRLEIISDIGDGAGAQELKNQSRKIEALKKKNLKKIIFIPVTWE